MEHKEVAVAPASGFDRFIEMAIKTPELKIDTLERLLAMQKEIMAANAKAAFDEAMSAFQAECPIIPKTEKAGTGGFQYDYAPMDLIIRTVGPSIAKHGFSYAFDTIIDEGFVTEIMTVRHINGHAEKYQFRVPIDKAARMNDTQKVGSANTYAQRYVFRNGFGIMTGDKDNDGATATPGAAGHPQQTTPQPVPAKPTQPAPQPTAQNAEVQTACGFIADMATNPKPASSGAHRTKIVLDNKEAYYTFDPKVVNYVNENATKGKVTITYTVGKFGKDIMSINIEGADFKDFVNSPANT